MHSRLNILLVEDTPTMQILYASILAVKDFTAICVDTLAQARAAMSVQYFPIVLLDLSLPDGDGLDLLDEILRNNPQAKIIVITANGSMNKAIEAMRRGACDFLVKPCNAEKLIGSVEHAFSDFKEASDPVLTAAVHEADSGNFVGSSASVQLLRENIDALGPTNVSVLVYGERGVDKDLCVSLLRYRSPNRDGPVLEVNCSDPDQDAVARKLFGNRPLDDSQSDAATDAGSTQLFSRLSGGTLILKELGGLSNDNQIELLEMMQRSGASVSNATKQTHPDVRIICTSTENSFQEVIDGSLRQDLFFRWHFVPIIVPPMRERREDIIYCAESFLLLACAGKNRPVPTLSEDLQNLLINHDWPGNLTEMRELFVEMISFYDGPVLDPSMLGPKFLAAKRHSGRFDPLDDARFASDKVAVGKLIGLPLTVMEQKFIEATIDSCDGSVTKAAVILNVAPSTLYRKRDTWQNSSVD